VADDAAGADASGAEAVSEIAIPGLAEKKAANTKIGNRPINPPYQVMRKMQISQRNPLVVRRFSLRAKNFKQYCGHPEIDWHSTAGFDLPVGAYRSLIGVFSVLLISVSQR
jgi:hypothetical protein